MTKAVLQPLQRTVMRRARNLGQPDYEVELLDFRLVSEEKCCPESPLEYGMVGYHRNTPLRLTWGYQFHTDDGGDYADTSYMDIEHPPFCYKCGAPNVVTILNPIVQRKVETKRIVEETVNTYEPVTKKVQKEVVDVEWVDA